MGLTTSQPNQRGLPEFWIDRLFARLAGLYGRQWLDLWADVPMADVKDAWREALWNISGSSIKSALEHISKHNKFPPSAPEFAAICANFRAPIDQPPALPLPSPTAQEREQIAQIAKAMDATGPKDSRKWAHDILAMEARGEYRMPGWIYGLACAREALGLDL